MVDGHLKHLFARAGFGLPRSMVNKSSNIDHAIEHLFAPAKVKSQQPQFAHPGITPKQFRNMNQSEKMEALKMERINLAGFRHQWLIQMAEQVDRPLQERMTLFWHGHFACECRTAAIAERQIQSIREHALGNFRDLCLAVAKDPGMIRYLNNQENRKQSPNENFARELLELFTIGIGQYTEQDIKEAARAFTGWSSNLKGEYVFRPFFHDYGPKSFMGQTGTFNGEDIIDIILEQKGTAQFLARKIYRYFVNDRVNEDECREIGDELYQSNYDIARVMRHIFTSDWFYRPEHYASKIKSPVDLLVGMIHHLDLSIDHPFPLNQTMKSLGQIVCKPPNVAGWPYGKGWIDNTTLLHRLNLPKILIGAIGMQQRRGFDPEMTMKDENRSFAIQWDVKKLERSLAQSDINSVGSYLIQDPASLDLDKISIATYSGFGEDNFLKTCLILMSTPEYQMC